MKTNRIVSRSRFFVLIVVLMTFLAGCATVPKEVVELSYRMGEDLAALHESYDLLIHEYYGKMRNERITYLDEVWYPRFIEHWMEIGEVQAIAAGEKIWSVQEQQLILKPSGADNKETLHTLQDWLDYALYAYEKKEDNLLSPLNNDEAALRRDVSSAFQQIMRANATITAHLNSIREVKEVQDEAFDALGIRELRDSINEKLIKASEQAEKQLDEIRKADENMENIIEQINQ